MNKYFILVLKVIAAFIMLQTLFFKFTGAQESIDLFTEVAGKDEVFMRIGTGVLELIASILIFIPKTTWIGALLAVGIMFGAILSHITILGVEFNNDGGALFYSAITTFIASGIILFFDRRNIPIIGKNF